MPTELDDMPTTAPDPSPRAEALQQMLEVALGIPFTPGNDVDVLKNGDEIFPAMLEAIERAEHTIEFLTFVYWQGDIARRFAGALSARARAGVRVQVLLDAVGAFRMDNALLDGMKEAGANVFLFRPPSEWWKFWRIDHRTHRKILVCDGDVAFTGGVGIAEEWEGDARTENEWRETHFRVRGPAVSVLRAAFLGNWAEAAGLDWARRATELADSRDTDPAGPGAVQVVRSAATSGWSDARMLHRLLIAAAQDHLRITTAYFVPDRVMHDLLIETAQRGVQIDILLPGDNTDEQLCNLAAEAQFRDFLEAGIRLWKYQPTMLHAKIMIIDSALAVVGSANFNHRSMDKDDEVCMNLIDPPVVQTLIDHFEQDLQRSKQTTRKDWQERPWWRKAKSWMAHAIRGEL